MHLFQWKYPPEILLHVAVITAEWCIVVGVSNLWIVFYTHPTIIFSSIWVHNDPGLVIWGRADQEIPSIFNGVVHCSHFVGLILVTNIGITHQGTLAPLFYPFDGSVCPLNEQLLTSIVVMASFSSPHTDKPIGVISSQQYVGPGGAPTPIIDVAWRNNEAGVSGVFVSDCLVHTFAIDYDERIGVQYAEDPVFDILNIAPIISCPSPIHGISLISNEGMEIISIVSENKIITTTFILDDLGLDFFLDMSTFTHAPVRITRLPSSDTRWELKTHNSTTYAECNGQSVKIAECGHV